MTRTINGRRGGSCDFAEWLAPLLISKGFRRGILEPCLFVRSELDLVYVIHVDDFLASGPATQSARMLSYLSEEMLLNIGEPLSEEGSLSKFQNFLSRERSRPGDVMLRRVSKRYVMEAAELLGLGDASAGATACVADRKKRAP